jgi:hypothetical protein
MPALEKSISENPAPVTGHILAVEINDFHPPGKSSPGSRSRVIPNILHLLDHIDKHRAEGNFYITPDLMRDFPEVVSLVSSRGHEIGLCCDLRSYKCPGNIKKCKDELDQIIGHESYGNMLKSELKEGRLHLKKLAAGGFSYSLADFNPAPHEHVDPPVEVKFDNDIDIHVFPSSRYKFLGIKVEFGLAGRIRLYPYWFLRRCMRYFTHHNIPAVMNFPLWEFDPHLPRQVLGPLQSLKSYGNLSLAEFKLTRLLLEFDFIKVTRYLEIENADENIQ